MPLLPPRVAGLIDTSLHEPSAPGVVLGRLRRVLPYTSFHFLHTAEGPPVIDRPASRGDIARVVAARFLSRAGSEAAFFIGVWGTAAYTLRANPTQLAALMATLAVASIVGSMIAGVLVDRHGPRRVLAFAEVLFVPAALAVPLAQTMPQLTVLVAVWAFVGAPVVTAGASIAPLLAGHDEAALKRMNSLIDGAATTAFVVGPALGAIIVGFADPDWLFALDAATSLIAAVLVWRTALPSPEPRPADERHPLAELHEGLKLTFRYRSVRYYVFGGMLVWLGFGAFGALEPLFYRDVVKTGVQTIGYMNTLFGLGLLGGAAALRFLPKTVVSAKWATLVVAATGLGTIFYVGSSDLRVIAVGAVGWSLFIGLVEPLLRTLLHRDTPSEYIGRVMGTSETSRRAGELIPLAVAPWFAARFGVQATLIGGGLVVTAIALAGLPEALAIDRERAGVEAPELEGLAATDEPKVPTL